jgi:hypothetical protein
MMREPTSPSISAEARAPAFALERATTGDRNE